MPLANGPNCGISDMNAIIKMIDICDRGGQDAMSNGVTVSWTMESFERGVFRKRIRCAKYPEGFEPNFGNAEAGVTLTEMIRDREGIGDSYHAGRSAQALRSTRSAGRSPISGHECQRPGNPGYDARTENIRTGPCRWHAWGMPQPHGAYDPDIKGDTNRFTVDDTRGAVAKDWRSTQPSTIPFRCAVHRRSFTGKADRAGAWPAIAALINATTGWEFDYVDVDLIGERAFTIKKAFNIREGWTRSDDAQLPLAPTAKRTFSRYVVTEDELEYMKDLYYAAKGWTKDGLIPKEKLIAPGMDDVAEQIGV